MTTLGPAAIALGFAVYANFAGAYLKDSADDGIEYLEPQASLHSGGCSGRCQYQMWIDRYPSIELGESYHGDDPLTQAMREFDPLLDNPQARECLHVPVERRPWGNRPGRGGYMPGPQPGCKDNGTDIDYPPIVGLPPEALEGRQVYPPKTSLPKWTPHGMPKLRSEAYNYSTFTDIRYIPERGAVLAPYSGLMGNIIPRPGFSEPGVNSPPYVLYDPTPSPQDTLGLNG
jgi:hypothetical protein